MFHFVAQNLALRRLCKNRKILIQNICLGVTWKKQWRKLKRPTCLKSQPIAILLAVTQNLNFPPANYKIRIFCTMATKLHQTIKNPQKIQQPEQPSKLPDQEPVCTNNKEIGTSQLIDSPEIKFIAGNLKHCYPAWNELTSDPDILNIIIEGLQINFNKSYST